MNKSTTFLTTKSMTLISIEQFNELAEDYPELAQLIHIHDDTEEPIADTCAD
jgi:hypothetical protein